MKVLHHLDLDVPPKIIHQVGCTLLIGYLKKMLKQIFATLETHLSNYGVVKNESEMLFVHIVLL